MFARKILTAAAAVFALMTMTSARPQNGTISGRVTFEGTPAKPHTIDMSMEIGRAHV
jgi:hypothetical protein